MAVQAGVPQVGGSRGGFFPPVSYGDGFFPPVAFGDGFFPPVPFGGDGPG
jgi:hypothetical protein